MNNDSIVYGKDNISLRLKRTGDFNLLALLNSNNELREYVVCMNYNTDDGTWSWGNYFQDIVSATKFFECKVNGVNNKEYWVVCSTNDDRCLGEQIRCPKIFNTWEEATQYAVSDCEEWLIEDYIADHDEEDVEGLSNEEILENAKDEYMYYGSMGEHHYLSNDGRAQWEVFRSKVEVADEVLQANR